MRDAAQAVAVTPAAPVGMDWTLSDEAKQQIDEINRNIREAPANVVRLSAGALDYLDTLSGARKEAMESHASMLPQCSAESEVAPAPKSSMTREEIKASCERARLHIEKHGIGSRPITDAQRARFEELKAERLSADTVPAREAVARILAHKIPSLRMANDTPGNYAHSIADEIVAALTNEPQTSAVQAERDRCVALCEGWMERFEGTEIQYTSPREYACDAINDIMDLIRDGRDPSSQVSRPQRVPQ
jgi:hypothetical protein